MNRRKVLQMTGIGAVAAASAPIPTQAEEGLRLREVAIPAEIERVYKLPYWDTRPDFKILSWHVAHGKGALTEAFNEMAIAGYDYVECTYCDGISGQYVFQRRVPREVSA